MTPGRHLSARKRQVYQLVEGLTDELWTPTEIGEAIGYSDQQVRNILRDLGRKRFGLAERIERLPSQKRRQLEAWRQVFFENQTFAPSPDLKSA